MSLPVSIQLPVAQGVLYTVPANLTGTIGSIHVVNESSTGRTFTIWARPPGGIARPISPVSQALVANALAIYADPLVLTAGCTLEGAADATGVSCFITGKET